MPNVTTIPENIEYVLLHGYGANASSWDLVADSMNAIHSTHAIELVGFGRNVPPKHFDYSLESQAQHLAQLFRNRSNSYRLVAHSLGAAIAVIALLDFKLDPKELILISPLLVPQEAPFFISIHSVPLLSNIVTNALPPSILVDSVLKRIYFDPKKINADIRSAYIGDFSNTYHRRALRETARTLYRFDAEPYVSRFNNIETPVTIIWSREDPLLPFRNAATLQSKMPNSRLFPIDNCGHAPHEECPGKFVEAFLSSREK